MTDTLPVKKVQPVKLNHAEPLYIDLIRDLGARKGEREWNVGMGMTDVLDYDRYEFLVEYEWAIIDRLGLELEVPVTLFSRINDRPGEGEPKPANRVESLKLAAQYTFCVSEKWQTSLAIGGITELEFVDLNKFSSRDILQGILFNPFFVAAKRWGSDFHSLVYTGPRITNHFGSQEVSFAYEINTNFHYMIPGSRNFVGIEFNKLIDGSSFDLVIRPQMRLALSEHLLIGVVPGIPISRETERYSAFMRLIYEPKGKQH